MSDTPTPKSAMQDRRYKAAEPLAPDKAPAGLQEAIRQLDGNSWEKCGSGAMVNLSVGRPVHFNQVQFSHLNIHQANPDAIAELIKEARHPNTPQRKSTPSGKTDYGAKRIR